MISHVVEQLVQDIFLQIKIPRVHDEVKEDPEAYLISLLWEIKETMSGDRQYRATLHNTVQAASYDSHLEKVRKLEEPVLHG